MTMEKNSLWKALSWAVPIAGTSGLTTYTMDRLANPDKPLTEGWDTRRIANAGLNAILGAGAGVSGRLGASLLRQGLISPASLAKNLGISTAEASLARGGTLTGAAASLVGAASMIGLAPAKDLLINAQHLPSKMDKVLDATHTELKNRPTTQGKLYELTKKHGDVLKFVGGGALGLGAIGLAAKLLSKDKKKEVGHIRYRIPGRNGDPATEAVVELPLDTAKLSPTMLENIETNIKRQAVKNIKANMRKRDPHTGKLIPLHEWERRYLGGEKSACALLAFVDTVSKKPTCPTVLKEVTPCRLEDFYAMQAGAAMKDGGAGNVKVASSAFAEGAGSVTSSLLGLVAGRELGRKLYGKNPAIGGLVGSLAGGILPALLGRAVAKMHSTPRTEEEQAAHDEDASTRFLNLLPGYAHYQNVRRESVAKAQEIVGDSFEATGMSPIQASHGTTLEDAAEADEITGRSADDDEFYEVSKFASAPPAQGAPQAKGQGVPVKTPSTTAEPLAQRKSTSLTARMTAANETIKKLKQPR